MNLTSRISGALADRIGPRTIDKVESVASVLLAILFAHTAGAQHVNWAAFAGYMVMRGHAGETVLRAALRIVGTISGGLLSLAVVPLVLPWWPLQALALLVVGGVTLYFAITSRRAYAWLFVGLTFAMVLMDKVSEPHQALWPVMMTRMVETAAGTLACVIVSLLSGVTLRRIWPAVRSPKVGDVGWHSDAARHAAQGGVALAILAMLEQFTPLPDLSQAAVTIMAVMLVPVADIGASGLVTVSRRIAQRFVGCLAGAAMAATILFLAQGNPAVLIAGTALGVVIGRHIESGQHARRYVGTQFVLATLVTMVPDSFADADIRPSLQRLGGIMLGMIVLEPVLLAWHWIAPIRAQLQERMERGGGAEWNE